jgi:hypothetical protein
VPPPLPRWTTRGTNGCCIALAAGPGPQFFPFRPVGPVPGASCSRVPRAGEKQSRELRVSILAGSAIREPGAPRGARMSAKPTVRCSRMSWRPQAAERRPARGKKRSHRPCLPGRPSVLSCDSRCWPTLRLFGCLVCSHPGRAAAGMITDSRQTNVSAGGLHQGFRSSTYDPAGQAGPLLVDDAFGTKSGAVACATGTDYRAFGSTVRLAAWRGGVREGGTSCLLPFPPCRVAQSQPPLS